MILFDRGIIRDSKYHYLVRVHSTNQAALNNSASDYVDATFYARTAEKQKRLTGDKSIIYSSGLVEITRAISIQKSVMLRVGLIKSSDVSVQEFLNRVIRRGVVNISKDNGSTWLKGYCTNTEVATMEAGELYKYDFEFVYGFIEEVI